jgi:WD40 repeat protein
MICRHTVIASLLIGACSTMYGQPASTQDGFPMPPGAIHRFGNRQARHPEGITGCSISPDGKYLATLGSQSVVVWDTKSLNAKCTLSGSYFGGYGYADRSTGVRFLPDSKTLLVTVRPTDRTSIGVNEKVELAQVWDVETGKKKYGLKGGWGFTFASWPAKDGKEIALLAGYRDNATITFFDAKDGKELRSTRTEFMNRGLWIAANGKTIAVQTDNINMEGLTVRDTESGKEIDQVTGERMVQAALSPDGKLLLFHDQSGKVRVRDVQAKKELFTFNHPAEKQRGPMLFSKDQQTLYFGGQYGQLLRWDLKNNKRLPDVGQHSTWTLTAIALSPDESILYSMGGDKIVKRWDLKTGKQLPVPEGYTTQTAVVPAMDGKHLIVCDHAGTFDYWDIATGKHVKQLQPGTKGGFNCVAVSSDGRWFAGGRTQQDVQFWDLTTGKLASTFGLVEKPDPKGGDHVQRVFFRPDGKVLYTTSGKTGITAWSVPDAKKLWRVEGIGPHAACDSSGRWIAVGGGYKEPVQFTILDASTGDVVRRIDVVVDEFMDPLAIQYSPYVTDFAFIPGSSRLVTSHYEGTIRIWDPTTGQRAGQFAGVMPSGTQQCLACSPDGKWLGVGRGDRKISIWEVATGKEALTISGHDSNVRDIAFTRDGKGIVGNADLSPVLWSLSPTELLTTDRPIDTLWEQLATNDAPIAYRLVWSLAKDPRRAIEMFTQKIKPKELAVEREQFDKWVGDLENSQFRIREVAERNLIQAGLKVPVEWLRKAIADTKGDEAGARLRRVLTQREKPDPNEWRLGRAVQVLALADTDETKALLKSWADSVGSALSTDAKAAMERLNSR